MILDFYHACEHVSDLCKRLYGEQTPEYWKHFKSWTTMLEQGGVEEFLEQVHALRDKPTHNQPPPANRLCDNSRALQEYAPRG